MNLHHDRLLIMGSFIVIYLKSHCLKNSRYQEGCAAMLVRNVPHELIQWWSLKINKAYASHLHVCCPAQHLCRRSCRTVTAISCSLCCRVVQLQALHRAKHNVPTANHCAQHIALEVQPQQLLCSFVRQDFPQTEAETVGVYCDAGSHTVHYKH